MKTRHLKGLFLTLSLVVGAVHLAASPVVQERDRSRPAREAPDKSASQKSEKQQMSGIRAGTRINAELESTLDAKTAKPDDQVAARVTKDVKENGRTVVRKGDRLIGKVVEARADATGKAGSQLNVVFDRLASAQGETQLNTVLSSVLSTPSEERAERQQQSEAPPMMEPMPAPSGGAVGGGGGLVGGVTSSVGSTVGAATGAVGSTVGGVGGTLDAATRTTAGNATNLGLATPMRAIHIESRSQAENQTSANSVLSTRQGDLRLESGTRMQFRVAANSEANSK